MSNDVQKEEGAPVLSLFETALRGISDHEKIRSALKSWSSDERLRFVEKNIVGETALVLNRFEDLLTDFASFLTDNANTQESWMAACRKHKFAGVQVPLVNCPTILGRVRGLEDYAFAIEKASSGKMTKSEVKKHLEKLSASLNWGAMEMFIRTTPLGEHIVWATFDLTDSGLNPFDRLTLSRELVCAILGLGDRKPEDAIVLLVWNYERSGAPRLHRPTIADAEDSPFYKPRNDPDAFWGLTAPLSPHETLDPLPEVVLPPILGTGLVVPFRVY